MHLFKSKEEKLEGAISDLQDALFDYQNFGYLDSPSAAKRRKKRIQKIISKIYSLEGDPLDYVSHSYTRLIMDAMGKCNG